MNASREDKFEPWKPFNLVCFDFEHVVDKEDLEQVLDADITMVSIIRDVIWMDKYGQC